MTIASSHDGDGYPIYDAGNDDDDDMTAPTQQLRRGDIIDIDAMEWFDKVNGNSYCAVRVYINGTEVDGRVEFGYGYGDAYRQYALELLTDLGYVSSDTYDNGMQKVSWRELRDDDGIAVHPSITTGLKREVIEHGRTE
jgi:hypothetical protein